MDYKGAIFDMDGTLIDSLYVWEDLGYKFLEIYDIKGEKDLNKKLNHMTSRQSANYFIKKYKLDLSIEDILLSYDKLIEYEYKYEIKEKPGVRKYLENLKKKNLKLCVLTLSSRNLAELVLQRLDLIKYFDFIITAEELELEKTNPKIYLKTGELLSVEKSKILVYEDSLYCIKSAKLAGFTTVGVEDYYSIGDRLEIMETSDYYISSYEDIELNY